MNLLLLQRTDCIFLPLILGNDLLKRLCSFLLPRWDLNVAQQDPSRRTHSTSTLGIGAVLQRLLPKSASLKFFQ